MTVWKSAKSLSLRINASSMVRFINAMLSAYIRWMIFWSKRSTFGGMNLMNRSSLGRLEDPETGLLMTRRSSFFLSRRVL